MNLIVTILLTAVIIFIAVMLLGLRVFFTKKGEFPNIHIGGNKALREQGVNCATSQDAEVQKSNSQNIEISKLIHDIEENKQQK